MLKPDPIAGSNQRRIRLLLAIPELDRGGPDKVFSALAARLPRTRFDILVAVARPGGQYWDELPMDVDRVVLRSGGHRLLQRYPVAPLAREIRRGGPDVVLATLRMNEPAVAGRALRLHRAPVVARLANQPGANWSELVQQRPLKMRAARGLSTTVLRRADLVLCQSRRIAEDVRGLDPSLNLAVIGNGVDVEEVRPRAVDSVVLLDGSPRLLAVGRLTRQKGFDVLIDALPVVRHRFPDAHLTVVGEGPDSGALHALAARRGVERAVTFKGQVSNPYPYMKAADLVVAPSRYEGFSNAILEALACGTPVVATADTGTADEVILPGRNGWLASTASVEAVSSTLVQSLDHGVEWGAAEIAMDCARRYGVDRMVADYASLLEAVVIGASSTELGLPSRKEESPT